MFIKNEDKFLRLVEYLIAGIMKNGCLDKQGFKWQMIPIRKNYWVILEVDKAKDLSDKPI